MAAPKGIAAIEWLAKRTKEQRGGNDPKPDHFDRSTPDALALWRDAYLEMLKARNYAEGTVEGRVFDLKCFLAWAEERELKQAGQITRPILEAFQRALWRYTQPNGQRLRTPTIFEHGSGLKPDSVPTESGHRSDPIRTVFRRDTGQF